MARVSTEIRGTQAAGELDAWRGILKLCDNDWQKIRGARVLEGMESVFHQRPLTALLDLT